MLWSQRDSRQGWQPNQIHLLAMLGGEQSRRLRSSGNCPIRDWTPKAWTHKQKGPTEWLDSGRPIYQPISPIITFFLSWWATIPKNWNRFTDNQSKCSKQAKRLSKQPKNVASDACPDVPLVLFPFSVPRAQLASALDSRSQVPKPSLDPRWQWPWGCNPCWAAVQGQGSSGGFPREDGAWLRGRSPRSGEEELRSWRRIGPRPSVCGCEPCALDRWPSCLWCQLRFLGGGQEHSSSGEISNHSLHGFGRAGLHQWTSGGDSEPLDWCGQRLAKGSAQLPLLQEPRNQGPSLVLLVRAGIW